MKKYIITLAAITSFFAPSVFADLSVGQVCTGIADYWKVDTCPNMSLPPSGKKGYNLQATVRFQNIGSADTSLGLLNKPYDFAKPQQAKTVVLKNASNSESRPIVIGCENFTQMKQVSFKILNVDYKYISKAKALGG